MIEDTMINKMINIQGLLILCKAILLQLGYT